MSKEYVIVTEGMTSSGESAGPTLAVGGPTNLAAGAAVELATVGNVVIIPGLVPRQS